MELGPELREVIEPAQLVIVETSAIFMVASDSLQRIDYWKELGKFVQIEKKTHLMNLSCLCNDPWKSCLSL